MVMYRVEAQEPNGRIYRSEILPYRLARFVADSWEDFFPVGTTIAIIVA